MDNRTFLIFSLDGQLLTVEADDSTIIHIPTGMTPWQGEGVVPSDWDRGMVLTRCGLMVQPNLSGVDSDWSWAGDPKCPLPFAVGPNGKDTKEPNIRFQRLLDCIAYTKIQERNFDLLPRPS